MESFGFGGIVRVAAGAFHGMETQGDHLSDAHVDCSGSITGISSVMECKKCGRLFPR